MNIVSDPREELWTRVQAALDERRDPCDDEDVLASLAEHPECLPEIERLARRLERLPEAVRESALPRAAAALALVLAGAAVAWAVRRASVGEQPTHPMDRSGLSSANHGRVHALQWTITHQRPGRTDTSLLTDRGLESRVQTFDLPHGRAVHSREIGQVPTP